MVVSFFISHEDSVLAVSARANLTTGSALKGIELVGFLTLPAWLLLFENYVWSGPTVGLWFNHFLWAVFQHKVVFFMTYNFILILLVLNTALFYTSQDAFDYILTFYNFYL